MKIVYFSNVTENTHRFVQKLEWENITRIPIRGELENLIDEPYILIVPSYGTIDTGHVPPQVKKFLRHETNRNNCVGVIGGGNMNFAEEYAMAGDVIAERLQVPHMYRFELAGTTRDHEIVRAGIQKLAEQYTTI